MAYLTNAPSLRHIPCFNECWGWKIDLILHHWRIWKRIIAFCSWRRIQWRFFFFFLIWKSWIFSRNWKFWIFFFERNLRSTSLMPLVPRPFLKISFFFFFFFFWNMKICSFSKSEEDKDEDGVKVMKIYSWWFFFFFENPILWMRITLVGSWCGLLDKSLLNSYKKIISISNGFIHWNELEVLTQCP